MTEALTPCCLRMLTDRLKPDRPPNSCQESVAWSVRPRSIASFGKTGVSAVLTGGSFCQASRIRAIETATLAPLGHGIRRMTGSGSSSHTGRVPPWGGISERPDRRGPRGRRAARGSELAVDRVPVHHRQRDLDARDLIARDLIGIAAQDHDVGHVARYEEALPAVGSAVGRRGRHVAESGVDGHGLVRAEDIALLGGPGDGGLQA